MQKHFYHLLAWQLLDDKSIFGIYEGIIGMKQDLWLVNSSLIAMFMCVMGMYQLFNQDVPAWKTPKPGINQTSEEKKIGPTPSTKQSWEKIYLDDIFGTYTATQQTTAKQSFVTPIPEPKTPVLPAPPDVPKPDFIPPLNITLKGIIAGSDEDRNVAMIADETGKEEMYHLGEKVKDAQIVKIAHNRVIVLRSNGQQESFFLRKDDIPQEAKPEEKWKYTIKKVDDQHYDIDPDAFSTEVGTLGRFIERASVIGTAYQSGSPIGIRIGTINAQDVGAALGLMENDIITAVNGINVADQETRIKAYETVTQLAVGSSVAVGLKRAGSDVTITYKLVTIEKPRRSMFPGVRFAETKPTDEEKMKMSRLQQREQNIREFQHQHVDEQRNQQVSMDIRRRLLENLQQRLLARNQ